MERILVSACLLGLRCRYDGGAKPCPGAVALADDFVPVPFCPEIYGGLPTPRPPCEIRAGRAVTKDGEDRTEAFVRGAREAVALAQALGCRAALLKERSPSCGAGAVYDGTFTGTLTAGAGFAAAALQAAGVAVYGESRIAELRRDLGLP